MLSICSSAPVHKSHELVALAKGDMQGYWRAKVAGKLKVDLSISISLEKSTFVRLSVIKRGTILVVKVHPKAKA